MSGEKRIDELAALTGGRIIGDPTVRISAVASLEEAGEGEITFVADKRRMKLLKSCRATALILEDREYATEYRLGAFNLLLVQNPMLAVAKILELFRPLELPVPGVHASAVVHESALLGPEVSIGASTVVEAGAKIGAHTILMPGVYVGRGAEIGTDSIIYPGAAIRERCSVGSRVIIHCNAVVGSDGFGYTKDGDAYYKIPQTGIVRIGDDVEIGACVTIDRATIGETVIQSGTKIDNLVQIAHNVKVGEHSVIAAQTGIAGSATVGSRVQMGGQSGVNGHIEIGSDAVVGAKAGVVQDMPSGAVYMGFPAIPRGEWLRAQNLFAKLPELKKKLNELKKRIQALEEEPPD
jgi:UDP-3-O-[3-hydroxymyristoyl] glucosamine N-acyltransferase